MSFAKRRKKTPFEGHRVRGVRDERSGSATMTPLATKTKREKEMNRNRASGPHGNRKASATPRWVGTNWRRPEVSIRRKGIGHAVARKVKATGIARIEAGEQLAEAVERSAWMAQSRWDGWDE